MVIFLNGSLKGKRGNGYYLLQRMAECEPGEILEKSITDALNDVDGMISEMKKAEALVIAAPLYVDGLPAQVLRWMETLYEKHRGSAEGLRVYVVSNLGFYESAQLRILLDVVKNWCGRMNFVYGGGVAVGAGGMMSAFRKIPLGMGPNRSLGAGLKRLAEAIREKKQMENLFIQPDFVPRFVYRMAAHRLFRHSGRKNGVIVR